MNVNNNKKELNECTYSIKQVFYVLGKKKKKKKKKKCGFQVTWNFKIGTVGRKYFYFVKKFYMGLIGKQYGRTGKSLQNP